MTRVTATAAVVVAALAAGAALSGCGSSTERRSDGTRVAGHVGVAVQLVSDTKPANSEDPEAAQAAADSEQAFALALLQQLNTGGDDGNVVVSPSSLSIALAMTLNGASGATREEMLATLQARGLTVAHLNAGWASLGDELTKAGKADGVDVESANSLWLQDGLPMEPAFMAAMAKYYRAGV